MTFRTSAILVSIAIVFASGGRADANELFSPSTVYRGDGWYVGVGGGVGYFDADIGRGSAAVVGTGTTLNGSGGVFSILGGRNYQYGQYVYGFEADISLGDVSETTPTVTLPSLDVEAVGTIRVRAGVTTGAWLFYGTAGLAIASIDAVEATDGDNDSHTHVGLVLGAGADYQLSENLVLRGEYQHSFLADETYLFSPGGVVHTHEIGADVGIFRAAVIWQCPPM